MDNKFTNRLKPVKGARARLEQVCQAELSCFLMKSLDPQQIQVVIDPFSKGFDLKYPVI